MGGVMDRIWRESSVAIIAGLLGTALLCSCLAGLMIGYLPLSPAAAAEALGDVLTGSDAGAAGAILALRLPRVLLAAGVGMGLALSGILMQAIFRNPMAPAPSESALLSVPPHSPLSSWQQRGRCSAMSRIS